MIKVVTLTLAFAGFLAFAPESQVQTVSPESTSAVAVSR
jgi:hypothetical protein